MEIPREQRVRHLADPAIRELRPECPQLEPLHGQVVLEGEVHVEDADLRVQAAQQQHGVPVAQELTHGARLPRRGGDQHQDQDERVRREQQVPAGVIVAGERQYRGGRDGDVGEGDDVHRFEPLYDATTPRCKQRRETWCPGVV